MPQAIPVPMRQQIWSRFQKGQHAAAIAAALQLCPRTVQHLLQRFQQRGQTALQPSYHAPDRPARVAEHLVSEAVALHQEHPTWGAGFLRVRLQLRHPVLTIPSERTLQRWFRRSRMPVAPPGRKPVQERHAACRPHEVWQMDASERIPLATGQRISWLRCVDEFTGAVLGTQVFPPRKLGPSAGERNPAVLASAIPPLGPAKRLACGQRHAVGSLV